MFEAEIINLKYNPVPFDISCWFQARSRDNYENFWIDRLSYSFRVIKIFNKHWFYWSFHLHFYYFHRIRLKIWIRRYGYSMKNSINLSFSMFDEVIIQCYIMILIEFLTLIFCIMRTAKTTWKRSLQMFTICLYETKAFLLTFFVHWSKAVDQAPNIFRKYIKNSAQSFVLLYWCKYSNFSH